MMMTKERFSGPFPSMLQVKETLELIEKLSPYLQFKTVPVNTKFPYVINEIPMCTVVRSGVIHLRRDSDGIVIASVLVPNVMGMGMGMGSIVPKDAGLFIETLSECSVASLTSEQAQALVDKLNLWRLFAAHATKIGNNILMHSIIMTAPTAYEVIRYQLQALMNEVPEIRENTTAANYILQRTRLSRSSVMKILAELKKGAFIEMDEGRLIKTNKLPLKY